MRFASLRAYSRDLAPRLPVHGCCRLPRRASRLDEVAGRIYMRQYRGRHFLGLDARFYCSSSPVGVWVRSRGSVWLLTGGSRSEHGGDFPVILFKVDRESVPKIRDYQLLGISTLRNGAGLTKSSRHWHIVQVWVLQTFLSWIDIDVVSHDPYYCERGDLR